MIHNWIDLGYVVVIYMDWWTALLFVLALAAGIYLALWLHDRNK